MSNVKVFEILFYVVNCKCVISLEHIRSKVSQHRERVSQDIMDNTLKM